ncbi:MAG: peptidylprolyl isomerase, partial [Paracoccus sp. (in: a-proteobacteria)]|nr:peptidylprolyl isomerase [Paracoccus sp. (in: a-proteobacteria)]
RQAAVAAAAEENAGTRAQIELQRRNTLATAAVAQLAEADPSDEDIAAAYERLFQDVPETIEYNAAHILVETEEEAREIKAQIDEGADFGDMAEQRSTGPSGPNRGDLGWFSADQMVAPFAEAVAALEPGQISDPVETEFGWHLIRLNDTRKRTAPELDEVREQLAQMVLREKVETEIDRLVSEARIERAEDVDPALMGNTDLLEAQ